MFAFPLITIRPRPVLYALLIPSLPIINPAVGKSGPETWFSINSSIEMFGFCNNAIKPVTNSLRLCGGIFVAIPTAIPSDPFIRRFGICVGKTVGSSRLSSKFGIKSTVSLSRSCSISAATLSILASVYLIAAALSPSTEPKFPCPSISGYLKDHSCAIRTRES